MKLTLHHPDDLDRLRERVSAERHALQRDRYRAVLLVAQGTLEGGDGGGRVVAAGTPEDVAEAENSHTAEYLKPRLTQAAQLVAAMA